MVQPNTRSPLDEALRRRAIKEYPAKTEKRFWKYVEKTETCWLWTGLTTTNGYGRFGHLTPEGTRKTTVRTHRFSWELHAGRTIPDGMEIDHTCHNPLCVRPEHLRLATRKQNSENRKGAKRANKSGVRGIFYDSNKRKYRARIGHNKRQVHVGLFDTLAEAEAAVIKKRRELFTHNDTDWR